MAVWILEYKQGNERMLVRFNTVQMLWEWLQDYYSHNDKFPPSMTVFTAECVFDGS